MQLIWSLCQTTTWLGIISVTALSFTDGTRVRKPQFLSFCLMVETVPAYALYPLSLFDRIFERSTFVTGWLVEGSINTNALTSALERVTKKWRMLAGRIESVKGKQVISILQPSVTELIQAFTEN